MAMGKWKKDREQPLFVAADDLPRGDSHPFYKKLNALLAEAGFDAFAEQACRGAYRDGGRCSIAPGVYFRMLFVGYFEGLDSQRGIAWRCNDSTALKAFLGLGLLDEGPDHSSLTRIRERLSGEAHEKVFEFMLKLARDRKLLEPKAVGVDSTTLEANAAMKSIVRRDTGADYQEFLKRLAASAGIKDPSAEDLRRFDRQRKGKTCSNQDWQSPSDPDAEIARMKDGTTHLAYKAEHVVDLASEFLLAARVLPATAHDATTIEDSAIVAQGHLDSAARLAPEPRTDAQREAMVGAGPQFQEVVADKGYCKGQTLANLDADGQGVRTYIAVPRRGQGKDGQGKKRRQPRAARSPEVRRAERLNAQRQQRPKGRALQRRRSEVVERSFAHVCETGGARRTWLRGLDKIQKRYWMVAAARNLGLLMLKLFGVGKPRSLQRRGAAWNRLLARLGAFLAALRAFGSRSPRHDASAPRFRLPPRCFGEAARCSTGC